jgi:hypothetical protein
MMHLCMKTILLLNTLFAAISAIPHGKDASDVFDRSNRTSGAGYSLCCTHNCNICLDEECDYVSWQ